jgi:hypothetical protein
MKGATETLPALTSGTNLTPRSNVGSIQAALPGFSCILALSSRDQRLKIAVPPATTKVIRCHHPNGQFSILAHRPQKGAKPLVLLQYGA